MGKTMCTPVVETQDPATFYGYPATATVLLKTQNDVGQWHVIIYAGAPASLFDNAPNGSMLINTTDSKFHVKIGAFGAADGTWTEEQLS